MAERDDERRVGDERQEQRTLLLSGFATFSLSLLGIAVGLHTGAQAIVFDGMYGAVDAGMTMVAWFAARLIARGDDRRFQYGYWHLEPLLMLLNSTVLLFACLYALLDGVGAVLAGGRTVSLQIGVFYAAAVAMLSFSAYGWVRHKSRGLGSQLLELDSRAWLLSGALNAGLCASFAAAGFLADLGIERYAAYVDPAVLIVLALAMAPLPIRTIVRAGREILQIAPPELDARVATITRDVGARHGFTDHRYHVTRVGRAQFIEIGFVAPSAGTSKTLGELDTIRQEIADAMGGLRPGYWLTVDFTADVRWI